MQKRLYILLFCALITGCGNPNPLQHQKTKAALEQDTATRDTPVETLKTLTAEISAVEQENQTLVNQNKELIEQDKKTLAQFKEDLLANVHEEMEAFKSAQIDSAEKQTNNANSVPRHNGMDLAEPHSDVLDTSDEDVLRSDKNKSEILSTEKVENNSAEATPHVAPENNVIPRYTIPVNATLTGVIAMQPMIGRIPIDGKVTDPYSFKVIIGPKNLAANGIALPCDLQGIVASGIAQGDLLGHCARGEITSMTFVFQDGRISTTQSKAAEPLGYIAAANGNPCILGEFHSNAAWYLGAQSALSGLQGYGNALSQSQMRLDKNNTLSQLIGSAHEYALGQGLSASGQAASRWWEQRVQNSFDFIYVPHIDPKTKKPLELNINIIQEIPIDYDPAGRKVYYAPPHKETISELD